MTEVEAILELTAIVKDFAVVNTIMLLFVATGVWFANVVA